MLALVLTPVFGQQGQQAAMVPMAPPPDPPPGPVLLSALSARNALELGFPSLAAELYRALLNSPQPPADDSDRLVLEWATALLDDGRPEEARLVLNRYAGPASAAHYLRLGLVAAALKDFEVAAEEVAVIDVTALTAGDVAWYHYLGGLIAAEAGDFTAANTSYDQAVAAAPSDLSRARFVLAQFSARLRDEGALSNEALATLRRNVDQFRGRSQGYRFAEQYAAALYVRGEVAEAVSFLEEQLQSLPPQEREVHDDLRLHLGLIAGARDGVGRTALNSLLSNADDRDKQRIALQLLAGASTEGSARSAFRATLDRLIGGAAPHPILEDLLLSRAQLALTDNRHADAEADANMVLERFPGSRLKPAAFGVLMEAAWQRAQYRRAAGYAAQAMAETPVAAIRASLGVLVAEAYFRAGDHRSAGGAYLAALADVPAGVAPGGLIFQLVISEIAAGRIMEAAARLDEFSDDPRFDPVSRWRAEWNLCRALQTTGAEGIEQAYQRISRLLMRSEVAVLPVELKVRMAWLQARLAFEAGSPEPALELVADLRGTLDELEPGLRAEVASSLALLESQANFALNRPEIALDGLRQLRADYPDADAAVFSYIIEAEAYAEQGQLVEAQRVLVKLADDFPESRFAAYALLQAALIVRRRGSDPFYQEAYNILERLVQRYPDSEVVFQARFLQGDLLRELNQFGLAQQVYELLVRDFPRHLNVQAAELALADCHAFLSATDPARLETAISGYERLQDLSSAPADLRLEAGFKHGFALVRAGRADRAQQVWWPVVNGPLLEEPGQKGLGPRGRYWMARIIFELGALNEQQGRLEQARDMYALILNRGLPHAEAARAAFSRVGGAGVVP